MIYDPKKVIAPQIVHNAPRGNRFDGDPDIAQRDGHCVQCRRSYFRGDVIIINRATKRPTLDIDSGTDVADGWHPLCWNEHHE